MADTSIIHVNGPCQIFVGVGESQALTWLGYTEDAVQLTLASSFEDVHADFGGPRVPVDVQWMGEQAFISMTLIKYHETVLQQCVARLPAGTPGAAASNTVGSLMQTEGIAYPIFIYSTYSTKTVYTAPAMVPCYLFGAGWLHDNFDVPLGVTTKKPRCIFRAIPVWNTSTLSNVLYTNTLPSPLPTID